MKVYIVEYIEYGEMTWQAFANKTDAKKLVTSLKKKEKRNEKILQGDITVEDYNEEEIHDDYRINIIGITVEDFQISKQGILDAIDFRCN